MTERKKIENFLRWGNKGDEVWYDENGRKVVRVTKGVEDGCGLDTLPDCAMYENGKYVGTDIVWRAVDFLVEGIGYDPSKKLINA